MYRENIYEIMNSTGEQIKTIIIPKNSGLGYVNQVLKEAGLKLDKAVKKSKNEMVLGNLKILLQRGGDIPQVVMDYGKKGEIVLGITGDDLYDEYQLKNPNNTLKIENTYDWCDQEAMFGRPALCLINQTGEIEDIPQDSKIAINSKYVNTTALYLKNFAKFKGISFQETIYEGDVEGRVAQGIADCGSEIVYSGKSLEKDNLKVVDIVRLSDIVVISPLKSKKTAFGQVLLKEYANLFSRMISPTESETSKMLKSKYCIGTRIAEEAGEVVKALTRETPKRLVEEAAQLEYTILAALVKKGITLEQLANQMRRNQK